MMLWRKKKKTFYKIALGLIFVTWSCQTTTVVSPRKDLSNVRAKIVIDAGHGGEDSGAVGRRGLLEKEITLDIAVRLQQLFHKYLPRASVVMTRSADHFVSLPNRVRLANEENPDVFISLHVNSSENKRSSGFEIFSLDVASDRHAERLANSENKVMGQKERGLPFILADLKAYSYRRESDLLANLIAKGIKAQTKKMNNGVPIIDRGYNQAIFHVLFVNSPAVIAELFFISNPDEEKMLSEKTTREYIARGIFLGTKKFLDYQMASRERHAASR